MNKELKPDGLNPFTIPHSKPRSVMYSADGLPSPFSKAAMAFRASEDAVAATLYQGSAVAFDVEVGGLSGMEMIATKHADKPKAAFVVGDTHGPGSMNPEVRAILNRHFRLAQASETRAGKPRQHGDVKSSAKKEVRVSGLLKGLMGKV